MTHGGAIRIEITPWEIAQLIFDSAFNMRNHVDEFAIRGVGMDVVRTTLGPVSLRLSYPRGFPGYC